MDGQPFIAGVSPDRAELEKRFSAEHRITVKRTVNVKKVKVAQPIGGLFDYVN